MTTELSSQQALEAIQSGGTILIDVRTPAEFEEVRATPAINLPLDRLTKESLTALCKGKKVLFICRSGKRGEQALSQARNWGVDCENVAGGTMAWEAAGCGVVHGVRKVISLERQVRICAGALVVAGTTLGLLGLPLAHGISLFVGGGLMFAGITDTCGMAMILARMPWNQGTGAHCAR